MALLRYLVAASLDGFIAGLNGETDWIPMDPDIDFGAIFGQFDTIVMGRRTYEGIVQRGGPMIAGVRTVVFSCTLCQADHPDVTIACGAPDETLASLRAESEKDIWLFGGGSLFRSLAEAGLVDTVEVAVAPVFLGSGIPLLPGFQQPLKLELTGHRVYQKTGMVTLEYTVGNRMRVDKLGA